MNSSSTESARPAPATTTLIRLEGRDVLGVLHRISTQSLSDLAPGQVRTTLFCDFRGRLLHRAAVAAADGAVWLLRDDAPPETLAAHVDAHVFREQVRNAGDPGDRRVRAVAGGFGRLPGTLVERDGAPAELQISERFGLVVENRLEVPDDPDAEPARIESGRPRHGHEVDSAFNPFEVGLAHEIHLSKGCFTGQEALMRMMTYGGVRRRLARVAGAGAPPVAPADLVAGAGAARAGRLTSVAANGSGWIGLAVVANDALMGGVALAVGGVPIESIRLFPATRPLGLPER